LFEAKKRKKLLFEKKKERKEKRRDLCFFAFVFFAKKKLFFSFTQHAETSNIKFLVILIRRTKDTHTHIYY
tara:strand:- start:180 stop:392 length:213 start_codon:yes stop_codon:yes gene_type:complete